MKWKQLLSPVKSLNAEEAKDLLAREPETPHEPPVDAVFHPERQAGGIRIGAP